MIHERKINPQGLELVMIRCVELQNEIALDWELSKVAYHAATNSIRARFRHPAIGLLSGVIEPDFDLRSNMTFFEISQAITIDRIVTNEFFDKYLFNNMTLKEKANA